MNVSALAIVVSQKVKILHVANRPLIL